MMRRSSATAARRRPSQASRSARSCGIGTRVRARASSLARTAPRGGAAGPRRSRASPASSRACRRPWCTRRPGRRAPPRSGAAYSVSIALVCCSIAGSSLKNVSRARRSSSAPARVRSSSAMSGLLAQEGPEYGLRLARAFQIVQPRLGQHVLKLAGALDGVLDGAVARVEGGDGVVLRAAEDRLHLADGAFEHRAAGQAVCGERRERGGDGVLVAGDLLAKLGDDRRRHSAPSPRCRRCRGRPRTP